MYKQPISTLTAALFPPRLYSRAAVRFQKHSIVLDMFIRQINTWKEQRKPTWSCLIINSPVHAFSTGGSKAAKRFLFNNICFLFSFFGILSQCLLRYGDVSYTATIFTFHLVVPVEWHLLVARLSEHWFTNADDQFCSPMVNNELSNFWLAFCYNL